MSEERLVPRRYRLPDDRESITHRFEIGGIKGYLIVGLYEDGLPGEIFIHMAKEGSTIAGLMDSFAMMTSMALQHGVSLELLAMKFIGSKFEPNGFTPNPQIPEAKSIMDYIFRWLGRRFLGFEPEEVPETPTKMMTPQEAPISRTLTVVGLQRTGVPAAAASPRKIGFTPPAHPQTSHIRPNTFVYQQDSPPCGNCGTIMIRRGSCYKCDNCGESTGCG